MVKEYQKSKAETDALIAKAQAAIDAAGSSGSGSSGGSTTTSNRFDGTYGAQVTYSCTGSTSSSEPCNRSFFESGSCTFASFSFSVSNGLVNDRCGWLSSAPVSSSTGLYSGRYTGTASGNMPISGTFGTTFQLTGSDVYKGNSYRITIQVTKR